MCFEIDRRSIPQEITQHKKNKNKNKGHAHLIKTGPQVIHHLNFLILLLAVIASSLLYAMLAAQDSSGVLGNSPGTHVADLIGDHVTSAAAAVDAGSNSGGEDDKGDRSFGGNRWPRQETLALLKIRSDMDQVFRDSSHKGPLWEEVSR